MFCPTVTSTKRQRDEEAVPSSRPLRRFVGYDNEEESVKSTRRGMSTLTIGDTIGQTDDSDSTLEQ